MLTPCTMQPIILYNGIGALPSTPQVPFSVELLVSKSSSSVLPRPRTSAKLIPPRLPLITVRWFPCRTPSRCGKTSTLLVLAMKCGCRVTALRLNLRVLKIPRLVRHPAVVQRRPKCPGIRLLARFRRLWLLKQTDGEDKRIRC